MRKAFNDLVLWCHIHTRIIQFKRKIRFISYSWIIYLNILILWGSPVFSKLICRNGRQKKQQKNTTKSFNEFGLVMNGLRRKTLIHWHAQDFLVSYFHDNFFIYKKQNYRLSYKKSYNDQVNVLSFKFRYHYINFFLQ